MKKAFIVLTVLMLCGCSYPVAYETVSDELELQQPAAQEMVVLLPEDDVVMLEDEAGKSWLCEDYTVCAQTMASGDLEQTLYAVTGFDKESLTLLQVETDVGKRTECVWITSGEGGEQLNRAVILDDGAHHYVLTLHGDAQNGAQLAPAWSQIAAMFTVRTAP